MNVLLVMFMQYWCEYAIGDLFKYVLRLLGLLGNFV